MSHAKPTDRRRVSTFRRVFAPAASPQRVRRLGVSVRLVDAAQEARCSVAIASKAERDPEAYPAHAARLAEAVEKLAAQPRDPARTP